VSAQEQTWEQAMLEIRTGRKETHWMWFVFPQLRGLGTSATAHRYGITGLQEAQAFAAHPILGCRLKQSIQAVLASPTSDMEQLFGSTDANKLLSGLTLFERIPQTAAGCSTAIQVLYQGVRDSRTLKMIDKN
jgi:uncharacterized protein (DUF1810 family)